MVEMVYLGTNWRLHYRAQTPEDYNCKVYTHKVLIPVSGDLYDYHFLESAPLTLKDYYGAKPQAKMACSTYRWDKPLP